MAPAAVATGARPRNAIASTSFVQAVLELDAQEKQERKMKVKRKKIKIFEEDEEEWEFKCCGVSGSNETLAKCIVDEKEGTTAGRVEERSSVKTVTALGRKPTVQELRSGSNRTISTEGQECGDVRGGNERRRKLVRWWTNLS